MKRILRIILFTTLMMTSISLTAFAKDATIYVSGSSGDDSNAGTSDAPVKTIEKALELTDENDTIQIIDSASSQQLSTDEPLCVTKTVTITGGSLTISRAGIVLGANATFKDISINMANPVRNAMIANGYTLALENVKGTGTYPVHLFGGAVTGYSGSGTLPVSGSAGEIVISGENNSLGNIYAGSLSEYGDANEWSNSVAITISEGAGGEIGTVYAHGATEPRGEGDGQSMTPDSEKYVVTGDVSIGLTSYKPAVVYGKTGGSRNADVSIAGGSYLISTLILNDLESLTVSKGIIQPSALNENLDVTICSGAELDLSAVIENGTSFKVNHFTGGGRLAMGQTDKLCIAGTVIGTTEFQVTDSRPVDRSTSGIVEYAYAYIDVTDTSGDGTFTFVPCSTQTGATLEKVTDSEAGTISWMTSKAPESADVKPGSFDIPTTSYTMAMADADFGFVVPVVCVMEETEDIWNVPLDITISKDGGEVIGAEAIYDDGFVYSVSSIGFEEIFGSYGSDGCELYFYTDDSVLEAGNYAINISVVLADDTTVTRTIHLSVTDDAHIDTNGDGKCDDCGAYMDGIGAKLVGYTISLNGNIGVNFYMELSDEIVNDNGAYMLFTLPNGSTKQVSVANATQNTTLVQGKTYYVFSCEVASYEMTRSIKAQMFDGSGNTGTAYSYTVRDYAEYIIENATNYSSNDVDFAKAMLNYGACAQNYFEVATDELANKNLAEEDQAVETLTAESLTPYRVSATSNELGTFAGFSLVLKSETTLKAYFKPADEMDVNRLTFTVNEQVITPVQSGAYYVLSLENIKAWDLDTSYIFKVSDGSTELEFACSALSYGYSVLNKGNSVYPDSLIQLISALRVYQQKSEVYVSGNS